jgi:Ca-activated chloride channel family protein
VKASRKGFRNVQAAIILPALCALTMAQESTPQKQDGPLVKLSLIVTDRSNHSVDDLKKEEILILEDKKPQAPLLFSRDDRPVYYALAIDISKSFLPVLGSALEVAKLIINNNRSGDQTFIETFIDRDQIETAQEFTSDKAALLKSLNSLRVVDGQSAVIDGIYLAVEHTAKHGPTDLDHRKVVVLITDGEDRASYYRVDALVKLLRENDVQVFVIGIVTKLDNDRGFLRPSPREDAEKLLNRVATETGGRVFFPKNMSELIEAEAQILHDLHTQYVVGYVSSNNPKDYFRKVTITVSEVPGREKLTAITRPGYLVKPRNSGSEKKSK